MCDTGELQCCEPIVSMHSLLAGTDANVTCIIRGDKGSTPQLSLENSANNFERGTSRGIPAVGDCCCPGFTYQQYLLRAIQVAGHVLASDGLYLFPYTHTPTITPVCNCAACRCT